jgi:glycosyltransferase involved in cell wall biosynthesis
MGKVVIISNFAESLTVFRGRLLHEMNKKGHEVIACAPSATPVIQEQLKKLGARYHHVPISRRGLNPIYDIYTLGVLIFFLRRERPDAILNYTIKPVLYGSLAGQLTKVPQIYSMINGRGSIFSTDDFKQKLVVMIAWVLFKICFNINCKVFFQNPDDIIYFRRGRLLTKPDQAVLVNGSGVDLNFFKPVPFPKKFSFVLMARLIKDKGIYEYIEAARIVKKKYPDVTFDLIGPLEKGQRSISKNEVESWQVERIVRYSGWLDDVRPALENTSVYVLPSFYGEGTPRSILEAMSMGRPIITTNAPGCKETVVEGLNGFLVPVRDPVSLANAIMKFIESPALIPTMGQQSRKIAEEKYDVHKVNKVILESMGL